MDRNSRVYLIANDDDFFAKAQRILEPENYQTELASSSEEFFAKVELNLPGCMVIDHESMPAGGLVLQERLHHEFSVVRSIFAVRELDMSSAIQMLNLGTTILMPKPLDEERLREEIRGAMYLSQLQWQERQQSRAVHDKLSQLTEEELQVMELMLTGRSIRDTEEQLVISRRTVNRRRKSVMEKMKVDSVAKLCLVVGKSLPEGMLIRTDPPESGVSPNTY